jgi:dipeptidyl aminopeptidase/acylaminoacyl peptidase
VTTDDPTLVIPIDNNQTISEAFQRNKVKTEFITIPGAPHGFRGDDATRANALTLAWFEKTLLKEAVQLQK